MNGPWQDIKNKANESDIVKVVEKIKNPFFNWNLTREVANLIKKGVTI